MRSRMTRMTTRTRKQRRRRFSPELAAGKSHRSFLERRNLETQCENDYDHKYDHLITCVITSKITCADVKPASSSRSSSCWTRYSLPPRSATASTAKLRSASVCFVLKGEKGKVVLSCIPCIMYILFAFIPVCVYHVYHVYTLYNVYPVCLHTCIRHSLRCCRI